VVAALRGKPSQDLPEKVSAWVQASPFAPTAELVQATLDAVGNIRNYEDSELAELWAEDAENLAEWHHVLNDLELRLR
jgi:hypothetical protein